MSERTLSYSVPSHTVTLFEQQAKQKIEAEGWEGRNKSVKAQNFLNCWVTEEAFKQILIRNKIKFSNRAMYIGTAQGAGPDFTVSINGKEVTVGIRSINKDSLEKYKTVAYPDDRIRDEKDKIAHHHIVCHNDNGNVTFHGVISKENLLASVENGKRLYSKQNQEYFRVIPLEHFSFDDLIELLGRMDRR